MCGRRRHVTRSTPRPPHSTPRPTPRPLAFLYVSAVVHNGWHACVESLWRFLLLLVCPKMCGKTCWQGKHVQQQWWMHEYKWWIHEVWRHCLVYCTSKDLQGCVILSQSTQRFYLLCYKKIIYCCTPHTCDISHVADTSYFTPPSFSVNKQHDAKQEWDAMLSVLPSYRGLPMSNTFKWIAICI